MAKNSLIYKITNLLNNKIYIGKSIHNNPNYFGSGKIIKQAIKKYGKDNFKREVLIEFDFYDQILLNEAEKFWIESSNSLHKGYNISEGGSGGDLTPGFRTKKQLLTFRNNGKLLNERTKTPEEMDRLREHARQLIKLPKTQKQIEAYKSHGLRVARTSKKLPRTDKQLDALRQGNHKRWHKEISFSECRICGKNV